MQEPSWFKPAENQCSVPQGNRLPDEHPLRDAYKESVAAQKRMLELEQSKKPVPQV